MYDGLAYTLDRLRGLCEELGTEQKTRLVTAEFLLKALAELGYRAQLQRCVVTEQPLTLEFVGWSSQLGGVLSQEGYAASGGTGRIVHDPKAIVILRQFLLPEFTAERLAGTGEAGEEAIQLVYDYLQTQIGQPLRSLQG